MQSVLNVPASPAPSLQHRVGRRALTLGALAGLEAVLAALRGFTERRTAAAAEALDERTKIAHLLRRTGFAFTARELEHYTALGYQGTLDALLDYDQTEDDFDARFEALQLGLDMTLGASLKQWWLLRMALTRRPLQEKMVLFWHGYLTSGLGKVGGKRAPLMLQQNQFFRQHALGDFRTILQGISVDPAMMLWLDRAGSRKSHPNENYSRELMELFTTGGGHFTEEDVREAARAFTGWTVDKEGAAVFQPRQFDRGEKTFMGRTGRWTGEDIVTMLVEHPATGWRLARKLWAFFAYADPDDDTIRPMVEAYYYQNFSVRAMLYALFTSDAFQSPRAYRARVKSPAEFVVGALRSLEVATTGKNIPGMMARMGQDLLNPPNVAGWPGGTAWLSSGTWLERINFINRIVTNRQAENPTKPVAFEELLAHQQIAGPEQWLDYLLSVAADGNVSAEARAVLLDYATDGGKHTADFAAWRDRRLLDERVRGLAYLVMAMPEYQLN